MGQLAGKWHNQDSASGKAGGFHYWIVVVLEEDGTFHTAYPDRRMEKRYGGDRGRANCKT